jgi:hypothetical protein
VPVTPVLEAYDSERRDVIKVAEQKGRLDSPRAPLHQPVAVRMITSLLHARGLRLGGFIYKNVLIL